MARQVTTRAAAPQSTPDIRVRMAALYAELQPKLLRILTANLAAPAWVYDEACQSAWGSLLLHSAQVRPGGELGWLTTTATHAALRTLRHERLEEAPEEPADPIDLAERRALSPATDPEQALELRDRLAEVHRLPPREQRALMLQGFGYDYAEIAAVTGDSRRTVTRQLTRARQRLARAAAEKRETR